jgi:hypothetical protein
MNKKLFRLALVVMAAVMIVAWTAKLYAIDSNNRYFGGALIGDQMQSRQKQDAEVQRRIEAQQAEIDRQQRELDRLKAQQAR